MQEMAATDTSAISRHRSFRVGKPDSPACQTGPSSFLGGSDSIWLPAEAEGTQ
jgi:hypothetical protein